MRAAKAQISLRMRRLIWTFVVQKQNNWIIWAFVVHKQNNWILKSISVESKCPDDTLRNCRIMWIRAFCASSRALFRVIRLVSFRIILFTSLYFSHYIFIFLSVLLSSKRWRAYFLTKDFFLRRLLPKDITGCIRHCWVEVCVYGKHKRFNKCGLKLKKRICSQKEQILSFKSSPLKTKQNKYCHVRAISIISVYIRLMFLK